MLAVPLGCSVLIQTLVRSLLKVNFMSSTHLVRVSCFGQVGRFRSSDGRGFSRGCRVVCRTARGIEVGQVLSSGDATTPDGEFDGTLLRALTPGDELLVARLEQNRHEAYDACVDRLAQHNINATLLDVEHLFDGKTLCFYFLGETSTEVESITAELADAYESKAQFQRFAATLSEGCGPDCGTEKAAGCGDSCSSCSIASACAAH